MSNDLISRKALLEEINSYVFDTVNPDTRRGEHVAKAHICGLIEKQPTAYDVDKVVERLNEARKIFESMNVVPFINVDRAINIVKAGGVND